MFSTTSVKVFTSVIVLGFPLVQHTHSHPMGYEMPPPEREPFLPVTDEHRAAWNRVIEDCFPLNSRTSLSDSCTDSLEEYFANEPVWSYNHMLIYDWVGWQIFIHTDLSLRRNHGPADFLNTDVPFWRHIFDGQIEQRQELFLRVVNDPKCRELASLQTKGMHDELAEHCAAREMYKYAAYLSACFDAHHRLPELQKIVPEDSREYGGLNRFEMSIQRLDDTVSDETLKLATKRRIEKSYLHASWVASHCNQHGLVLRPGVTIRGGTSFTGVTIEPYTSTEEKLSWRGIKGTLKVAVLRRTHSLIMKIAMKSGDDWAIRNGYMDRDFVATFGADLMQRYPLLMYRILGETWTRPAMYGYDFSTEDSARFRAKAYLLLVEEAGEEFARREYDPERLKKEIRYVKRGGRLKTLATPEEIKEKRRNGQRAL